MSQGTKSNTLQGRDYQHVEESTIINWEKISFIVECVVICAIPLGAIALSVASDFLFFNEILSATFLVGLILLIKIATKK